MNKSAIASALLSVVITSPALAHSAGDFIVRAGVATVQPNDSSGNVLNTEGARFSVDDNTQLGLSLGYMLTDNIGLELLAATPFKHDIATNFGGLGNIADTQHLPPTLVVQYYFGHAQSSLRPYIGAGINYTLFFNDDLNANGKDAGLSDLNLSNSFGLAANAGLDYKINKNWLVNGAVWYANIETEASYTAGGERYKTDVKIDPWVFMLALGYTF